MYWLMSYFKGLINSKKFRDSCKKKCQKEWFEEYEPEFLIWALGEGYKLLTPHGIMDSWNTRHSSCFIMTHEDSLIHSLNVMKYYWHQEKSSYLTFLM